MTRSSKAGRIFLAVPLVITNLVAAYGQAGWSYSHMHAGWGVAIGFACALESIGIYLAFEAHEALMNNQASGLLRMASYGVGLVAGALNYNHFLAQSLATAVSFGLLSAVSPWLWAVWSRARNRARLGALGLVDQRGVKLSSARRFFHPFKSLRVMSYAAWAGVTDPRDAVEEWERARGLRSEPALSVVDRSMELSGQEGHSGLELSGQEGHSRLELSGQGTSVSVSTDHETVEDVTVDRQCLPVRQVERADTLTNLLESGTKKAQLRYAFAVLGSYSVPGARAWLSERGVVLSSSNAYRYTKELKSERSQDLRIVESLTS